MTAIKYNNHEGSIYDYAATSASKNIFSKSMCMKEQ